MFVGYSCAKKGWKVYDLEMNESFVSQDIIFHKDTFSYSTYGEKEAFSRAVKVWSDTRTRPEVTERDTNPTWTEPISTRSRPESTV